VQRSETEARGLQGAVRRLEEERDAAAARTRRRTVATT